MEGLCVHGYIWCRHTANISVFIFYKISMNNVYCMKYLSQDLQVIKARFFFYSLFAFTSVFSSLIFKKLTCVLDITDKIES